MISRKAIRAFSEEHPDSRPSLSAWYGIVKNAAWNNLSELKRDLPHADLVGRRTVFNIKGGSYRLVARVNYKSQLVFVLYILTHAEYDKGKWNL